VLKSIGLVKEKGRAAFGLHSLRHFYASLLIDQDFQPKRVQQLMGHSSITTTLDVYAKLWAMRDEDLDKLAEAERSVFESCNTGATKAPTAIDIKPFLGQS
jgi:integrase